MIQSKLLLLDTKCPKLGQTYECRHEWQAVAPVGTTWLECPACTLLTGRFVGPVHKEGLYWMCNCGNDLFYVTTTGGYCGVCGIETTFD